MQKLTTDFLLHFLLQNLKQFRSYEVLEFKKDTMQMHCAENLNQIFPEMKLRGLSPNFYIQLSVRDLNISMIGPRTIQQNRLNNCGNINRSQIQECRNWERGRTVSFLGMFVSNFRYSAYAASYHLSSPITKHLPG